MVVIPSDQQGSTHQRWTRKLIHSADEKTTQVLSLDAQGALFTSFVRPWSLWEGSCPLWHWGRVSPGHVCRRTALNPISSLDPNRNLGNLDVRLSLQCLYQRYILNKNKVIWLHFKSILCFLEKTQIKQ